MDTVSLEAVVAQAFNPKNVETLAWALPPDGSNPIGARARAILVNRLRSALPGNYSQLFGTGSAFRNIFFPGYSPMDGEGQLNGSTGLDDGFWSSFSVATLCQEIRNVTSNLREQMLEDKINGDLSAYNTNLRGRVARWYGYMASITDGAIKTALAAFPDASSKAQAKQHYLQGLTSEAWINAKIVQESSGSWPDRDWELFHHWIKLSLIGASDEEVNQAIATMKNKGLPIPPELEGGAWQRWTKWLGSDLGGGDVSDATGPILETRCHVYPGSRWPSCLDADNSYEFTANGQPGNGYRRAPSSSCFAPGALVVMADGGLKRIETIEPGEHVSTPYGPKSVLLRAAPLRGERMLYRFQGSDFAFTATHPFVQHESSAQGAYASVDADKLAHALPSLSQFGLRYLRAQPAVVLNRYSPSGAQPFTVPVVEAATKLTPDVLYDLVIDFDEQGRAEYYIGDHTQQLLVSSELPRFLSIPSTTATVLQVLQHCHASLLELLERVPPEAVHDLLLLGFDSVRRMLLPAIGKELTAPTNPVQAMATLARHPSPDELSEKVRRFTEVFQAGVRAGYDQRMAAMLDVFLSCFASQFHAVLGMSWRSFDLTDGSGSGVLAVTPFALEVFDDTVAMPPEPTALRITLARGGEETARTLATEPSASRHRCYYTTQDVAYFSNWRAIDAPPAQAVTEPLWELHLTLQSRDGGQLGSCVGTVKLPWRLDHGFQVFRAPVLDAEGKVCGRVELDVRVLTPAAEAQEKMARAAWQLHQVAGLTSRLAHLAGDFIVENIRGAVVALQTKAASAPARNASLMPA